MSTISMRAADDAYVANHPRLIDDLKNYLQSNGAKTDETNIFKGCSVELTKKDDKWDFSDKDG